LGVNSNGSCSFQGASGTWSATSVDIYININAGGIGYNYIYHYDFVDSTTLNVDLVTNSTPEA
jgi:hypothetical protein